MFKLSAKALILPLIAASVIVSLPGAGRSANGSTASDCGPGLSAIQDPGLRAHFAKLERQQSAGAAKVCALYRNAMDTVVR